MTHHIHSHALVKVESVTKDYRLGKTTIHALRGLSFEIHTGELLSIVGPSGCGKSTLLNILGCIDRPSSGTVQFEGQDISLLDDDAESETRLRKIGFIFQSFNLVAVLNVRENIEFPLILAGVPKSGRRQIVDHLIDAVGLEQFALHRPDELSGGQRQRVAIARALVNKPRLVIADEPTANLDSETAAMVMELMRNLNRSEKVTFIFSTHNALIEEYASRVIHLRDGLIVAEDRPGTRATHGARN